MAVWSRVCGEARRLRELGGFGAAGAALYRGEGRILGVRATKAAARRDAVGLGLCSSPGRARGGGQPRQAGPTRR